MNNLVGSPAWLDKWTVWFGDLFQNNSQNSQITRFVPTVTAFNTYVRNSLAANKPYNQMASEIITATGTDSYTQGELSYEVGGVVTGGPQQDIFDQQIANKTATTAIFWSFESQLPAVPRRPRPPGSDQPVGLLHFTLSGVGHGIVPVAHG